MLASRRLIMCTIPRDRLPVVVLFAAIAVLHVVRFGRPLGFAIIELFVVTWLCTITLWELSGRERRWQWPAGGVG